MAKKKAKKVEKTEAKKAPTKKPTAAGWVVGVIIVIIILIAIILLLKGAPKAPPVQQPTAPTAAPKEPTAPTGPETVSGAPQQVKYCNISYAIGWPKNKLGQPCIIDDKKVSMQIVYSGKGDSLSGLWFQITTKSGKVQYLKDTRTMKKDDVMSYTIDVGEKITDLLALPIINEGGVDKACLNQRMLIIKDTQCVTG